MVHLLPGGGMPERGRPEQGWEGGEEEEAEQEAEPAVWERRRGGEEQRRVRQPTALQPINEHGESGIIPIYCSSSLSRSTISTKKT